MIARCQNYDTDSDGIGDLAVGRAGTTTEARTAPLLTIEHESSHLRLFGTELDGLRK